MKPAQDHMQAGFISTDGTVSTKLMKRTKEVCSENLKRINRFEEG
jgi:hypothetical protein